jgi:hypothetical protein
MFWRAARRNNWQPCMYAHQDLLVPAPLQGDRVGQRHLLWGPKELHVTSPLSPATPHRLPASVWVTQPVQVVSQHNLPL